MYVNFFSNRISTIIHSFSSKKCNYSRKTVKPTKSFERPIKERTLLFNLAAFREKKSRNVCKELLRAPVFYQLEMEYAYRRRALGKHAKTHSFKLAKTEKTAVFFLTKTLAFRVYNCTSNLPG